MKTSDFSYELPEELIAQTPLPDRASSRLMQLSIEDGAVSHHHFYDLPSLLRPGDHLVLNDTKVLPARLIGLSKATSRPVELLLLRQREKDLWETLAGPGKRARENAEISFGGGKLRAHVESVLPSGNRLVRFFYDGVFEALLEELGTMPLPPYIHEKLHDQSRYQTVYAREAGSAAAPTAGLHFTPELLQRLTEKGIGISHITLHVGLGTFRPVKEENIEDHPMHSEVFEITEEAAANIEKARQNGGRVIAVGTTSCRTLEACAKQHGRVCACRGETDIFIYPGFTFRAIDGLITNFHLPESTLLMLISALAGRERVLAAYEEAVRMRYRFFSFGDAMLIQ